ncbi:CpaF family protein [Myceligenerans xiligouense]|uniref:Flp pilus assembly CpaF family ATPase n=1 Tax=Myceligenerans xiligouense TaxID=253184 RepID=A0A3N4YK38_9MICO|nr:CpaF/VirB11 family protein [Myceligenerans xiligouense]RPF21469.1 Flp pilus assembly CpaF family ATPase [Myceligenerans xiligouense]
MTTPPSAAPTSAADDETKPPPAALPVFTDPVPAPPATTPRPESANPWTVTAAPVSQSASGGESDGPTPTDLPGGWESFDRRTSANQPTAPPFGRAQRSGTVRYAPDVDWDLVATIQGQVSEQLSRAVADNRDLSRQDQEQLAHFHTVDLIDQTMAQWANVGRTTLTGPQRAELARAVSDALFRLGRLQPLIEDDRVENININGCDDVELELTDGRVIEGPPVADSDQQLIDYLVFLASRSEVNARTFSEAQPSLHLRLDDGSRLAAVAWVSPRPQVTIRRHRLVRVTLPDLVEGGLFDDPTAATLLAAAVRAKLSVLVTGAPGAGKTTLLRALANEIPPRERIATVESEYELHLHQYRARTWAWEARPGTGEVGVDGRQAGEYSLMQAVWDVVRFNVSRVLVGEVRGREIVPLIQVTENGTGTLATTHSRDAAAAIRKLVTCAMQEGPQWDATLATAKLAESIDLVVHLELTGSDDGRPRRRVSEIVAIEPGDSIGSFATTQVYSTDDHGGLVPGVLPDRLRALLRHGFDLTAYTSRQEVN